MNRHRLAMYPLCPSVGCSEEETVRHMWDCQFAGVVWTRAEHLVTRAGGGHQALLGKGGERCGESGCEESFPSVAGGQPC